MLCRSIEACKLPATIDDITNSLGRANLSEISFDLMYKRPKTGSLYIPSDWNPFASLQTNLPYMTNNNNRGGSACERSMMGEAGPTQLLSKAKPGQSLKFGPSLPKTPGDGHLDLDVSDKVDGSEN